MFYLVKKAILHEKNVDYLMAKKIKGSKEINPWFFLSKIEKFEIVFLGAY